MAEAVPDKAKLVKVTGLEKFTAGIPMYLATTDGEVELSELSSPMSYVLSGDGPYLYRVGPVFTTLTKCDNGIAGLGEIKGGVTYKFAHMPGEIAKQVIGFFQWAEAEHQSEAIVLMFYNPTTETWRIAVPKQKVSAGNANYDEIPPAEAGEVRLGTWHSHGNMSAYHSAQDQDDEEQDDGLHMTSGNLLAKSANMKPSISCSIMVGGQRYILGADAVFADLTLETRTVGDVIKWVNGDKTVTPGRKEWMTVITSDDDLDFPEEWKSQLTCIFTDSKGNNTGYYGAYDSDDDWQTGFAPFQRSAPKVECWDCVFFNYIDGLQRTKVALDYFIEHGSASEVDRVRKSPLVSDGMIGFEFPHKYDKMSKTLETYLDKLYKRAGAGNGLPNWKHALLFVLALRDEKVMESIATISLPASTYDGLHGSFCAYLDSYYNQLRKDESGEVTKYVSLTFGADPAPCDFFTPAGYHRDSASTASKQYGDKLSIWAERGYAAKRKAAEDAKQDSAFETKLCGNCQVNIDIMYGEAREADCPGTNGGDAPDIFSDQAVDCASYVPASSAAITAVDDDKDVSDIETID